MRKCRYELVECADANYGLETEGAATQARGTTSTSTSGLIHSLMDDHSAPVSASQDDLDSPSAPPRLFISKCDTTKGTSGQVQQRGLPSRAQVH